MNKKLHTYLRWILLAATIGVFIPFLSLLKPSIDDICGAFPRSDACLTQPAVQTLEARWSLLLLAALIGFALNEYVANRAKKPEPKNQGPKFWEGKPRYLKTINPDSKRRGGTR